MRDLQFQQDMTALNRQLIRLLNMFGFQLKKNLYTYYGIYFMNMGILCLERKIII
jgi:hypothetical protein